MAKRSIQGFVELASGLGDLTRSRAKEAAAELLTLSGVEGSSKKVAKQASRLADDLLVAAEQNRKQVVKLVRSEVESALSRVDVGRLVSEVQGLGATVAALAAQVDDLARSAAGRPAPKVAKVVEVEPEPARVAARPASPAPAKKAPAKKAPAKKAPAKKAPAKKAPAKKAPAKKAASTDAPAATTAKKAPAKKAPARKAPAKKATRKATTKKSAATKAPAKKVAAKKASSGGTTA